MTEKQIDFDADVVAGCQLCWESKLVEAVKEEFIYNGSLIGPFKVQSAIVLECPKCGEIRYFRRMAQQWERDKAIEIATPQKVLTGNEFKFFRTVLGKSMAELGNALGVDKATISRWEAEKPAPTPQASRQIADKLLLHSFAAAFLLGDEYKGKRVTAPQAMKAWLPKLDLPIGELQPFAQALAVATGVLAGAGKKTDEPKPRKPSKAVAR